MKRAVLIAGPTSSGKSRSALAVAERVGGAIVNADSMQVYRDLHVLSARPGESDEARIPHHLYGFVAAKRTYSAGRWLHDVAAAIEDIAQNGRLPVIVGGTGLYFHALLHGLADIPETPCEVRRHWRDRLGRDGAAALHGVLAARDPGLAARLEPSDGQRIVRGLEVIDATGRPLSDWQTEPAAGAVLRRDEVAAVVLWPSRARLYAACDSRFDAMMAAGALDEVRRLKALDLDPGLPVMKALGVRQLIAHLDGNVSLEQAVCEAKTWTRRYAKRQMTWFRRNMIAWKRIEEQDSERIDAEIFAILRDNELTGQI